MPALFGRDDHVADNNGYVEEDKEYSFELEAGVVALFDPSWDEELVEDEEEVRQAAAQTQEKVTHLPPYYVEHDGHGWAVFNRKTGNIRKTLPSREKAREATRKLNRR